MTCPDCDGTGDHPQHAVCPHCGGWGSRKPKDYGPLIDPATCTRCGEDHAPYGCEDYQPVGVKSDYELAQCGFTLFP